MSISKRIICILLSLALLLTWPGFVQQADAVALDSAALAVGLLFCTWAGVTFATNQGAYNAVSNFLNSSVNGLKACTEVVAKNLVDGTLTLTKGVRDAFNSILPDINATFKPVPGYSEGSILGSAPIGVPLEASVYNDKTDLLSSPPPLCPGGSTLSFNTPKGLCTLVVRITDSRSLKVKSSNSSICGGWSLSTSPGSTITSVGFCFLGSGVACVYKEFYKEKFSIYTQPLTCYDGFSFSDAVYQCDNEPYSSVDSITFQRSQTINGTQAQNALTTADLPDTAYGDDRDRSIEIGAVTGAIAAGLAGSTTQTGLSPEELIEILKKGLLFVEIPETSAPTESTDPTKDPDEDTPIAPLPPDQFNFFGDALQKVNTGLERINESVENFKDGILPQIQLFMDSVAQGFIDVGNWFSDLGEKLLDGLKTLGENLSSWLKSLYDASVEFFTKTFPQWVSDFKTWAASLKQTIIDSIKLALTELFVPSANYWDTKITACKEAFPLFNSIVTTGQGLGGFFSGLGTRPPVIYIDLGNSSSWAIGGRTIFLDLTWYSKYKPTMDNVLSAFLWLLFAWRFFLKLPGLLRGEGGSIDRLNSYLEHRDK